MFVDEKILTVTAGKGGDGAALFRREIYVPRGGPDGGDGGRGGSVIIEGKRNLHALTHLAHVEKFKAQDGAKGGHRRSTGKSGENELIAVPLGTVIYQEEDGQWSEITEITQEDETYLMAKGGNGGWGNWRFRSSIQQAPDRFNPGLAGEQKKIKLVLKLIADVGLVGFPNAGKSTFLSVVSSAQPKIADYPFTTLEPQLGVAQVGKGNEIRQWIIADLPGLIEGASQGKGLGDAFLKHIERTHQIIHFLEATLPEAELRQHYEVICQELAGWSPELAKKKQLLALTKIDLIDQAEVEQKKAYLEKLTKRKVFPISSATHQGVTELLNAL